MTSRSGEEAFCKRAEVEAGSAGDDGELSAAGDFAEGGAGAAAVFAGSKWLVGIGDIDEVMRDAGALCESGLGGADIHAAIDGDGIATHNLAVEALGKRERERRLPAARGSEKQNDKWLRF